MNTHTQRAQEQQTEPAANVAAQQSTKGMGGYLITDRRPESAVQRRLLDLTRKGQPSERLSTLQSMAKNSPSVRKLAQLQESAETLVGAKQREQGNDGVTMPEHAVQRLLRLNVGIAPPIQRAEGEDEMSAEEKQKQAIELFKNRKFEIGGKSVQRVMRTTYDGGDVFGVSSTDLGTGTGTSKGTRDYVNDDSTPKPESVEFDYGFGVSLSGARKKVPGNKSAYSVDNPEADYSYSSGSLWDAGHKLGRQNGGLGNVNDWVFPQNPAFNQGNSRNMDDVEETNPLWRGHEDDFHEGVKTHGFGCWWIRLEY